MKRVLLEGLLTITLFLGIWYALSRVDWVDLLQVEQNTRQLEDQIGDMLWESIKHSEDVMDHTLVSLAIDSIMLRLLQTNEIIGDIKVHVIDKDEVNAFAMPGNRMIIHSGLIEACADQAALIGVIGHELAHIELDHVMKKLVKEVGLAVLVNLVSGSQGADMIGEVGRVLSSTAFDRGLEEEADLKAVEYLLAADIDPEPFATFLFNMTAREESMSGYLSWLSTHPASEARANLILESAGDRLQQYRPVLSATTWSSLKQMVE